MSRWLSLHEIWPRFMYDIEGFSNFYFIFKSYMCIWFIYSSCISKFDLKLFSQTFHFPTTRDTLRSSKDYINSHVSGPRRPTASIRVETKGNGPLSNRSGTEDLPVHRRGVRGGSSDIHFSPSRGCPRRVPHPVVRKDGVWCKEPDLFPNVVRASTILHLKLTFLVKDIYINIVGETCVEPSLYMSIL